MITINALGDTCPIPVVKTKKAISGLTQADSVETLVDNETAVQNLTKMAKQLGYPVSWEKKDDRVYSVVMEIPDSKVQEKTVDAQALEVISCAPVKEENTVVVISSDCMGHGNEELGKVLIKGFIYALSQQDKLPKTMLFYNGGAKITCEGSASIEDLKAMAEKGVEILTCGTCLNHYGIADTLQVGEVTNMYVIAEKMSGASLIVKP